jgi:membrane-associated phospholipid phosphatase
MRVAAAALLCAGLVALCFVYIDRPVEVFVNAHQERRWLFQAMASPSLLPLPFACIYMAVCALRRQLGSGLLLRLTVAILVAVAAKDELKWVFGRPWPESWVQYGVYAFHPFANSWLYGAFPSGHTTYIAAPMGVLWSALPQYRVVWAGVVVVVMTGLVGAGYHFVGDVIGGLFTGLAAAAGTMACLDRPR